MTDLLKDCWQPKFLPLTNDRPLACRWCGAFKVDKPEHNEDCPIPIIERLLEVERAAKEVLTLMDRVIDSFPDNKVPHPSIGECLEGTVALRRLVGG